MNHLLKINEYNELSLEGDWQEAESIEYWTHTKSSSSFGKYELKLIRNICEVNQLKLVEWGFGSSLSIEREFNAIDYHVWKNNDHQNKLWKITVVKVEDEWFYIFTSDVESRIGGNSDTFYKADQIGGLMSLLNFKIKEFNTKYNWR
jgi:hypothetical protein